jgi:hypothetical protein
MTQHVTLGAIGYNVTEADSQFIFEEAGPIFGCHTCFAFEKPNDLNDTPGIWWLTHLDASSERVPASHLKAAIQWLETHYGKSFEPRP